MNIVLLKLVELSLQAGLLTTAILLVRLLFKKLPAKYLCLLWAIVATRLIIPVSLESGFAIMPSLALLLSGEEEEIFVERIPGTDANEEVDYFIGESSSSADIVHYHVEIVDTQITAGTETNDKSDNYLVTVSPTPIPEGITNAVFKPDWQELFTSITPILFALWLLGLTLLLGYGVYSCVKVKRFVKDAILYEDNIRLCEGLSTPFLFGWVHPQIYLPVNMEENQMQYVVEHEKAHIARGDNYTKMLGYVLLSIYWFHPLIWVAYVMFCKDVERACDERVIAGFGAEDRKGYADALLKCSVDGRFMISNPLAFGETDVKKRIMGILKYKKPGRWLAAFAVLLCAIAVAGCFFVKKEEQKGTPSAAQVPTGVATATPMPAATMAAEPTATKVPTPTPLPVTTTETLLPIAMNESVTLDLNGDGTEETVRVWSDVELVYRYIEESLKGYYPIPSTPLLTVTDADGTGVSQWCNEDESPDYTTYYILDIDVTDGYKEIGIAYEGPSGDPATHLYRYVDGTLKSIGAFYNIPLNPPNVMYSYKPENWPSYQAYLGSINRTGIEESLSVPGDGTIISRNRIHLLETSSTTFVWRLQNAAAKDAELQMELQETYVFDFWEEDRSEYFRITSVRDFMAYGAPSFDAEPVMVPKNSYATFYAYLPDGEWGKGWIHFFYSAEETWDSEGWFYINRDDEEGYVRVPEGKCGSYDLFEGFSTAG